MGVFAKFLILGQFFKGRPVREIGLYASTGIYDYCNYCTFTLKFHYEKICPMGAFVYPHLVTTGWTLLETQYQAHYEDDPTTGSGLTE